MGITFTSSEITVINGDYTFEDIYQASQDAGNTYCKKMGTAYLIKNDLILGDEETVTTLTGQNISVTIEGDLFQITKMTELRLGTIDENGGTANGVYISCPNIKNGYGFGSKHQVDSETQSGNIFLYDSFIDIYGFWGFFGGSSQHCEVIDCLVNGFGRVEGANSILENITTQKSHGRYGVLAAKGNIEKYFNVSSKAVNSYKGHTCSVYFNPKYAPNMRVIGGTYDGYTEGLIYAEKNKTGVDVAGHITFVDSNIRNGFGGYYSDNTTKLFIAYTFNPKFKDKDNNTLSDVQVTIVNNEGAEVFNGTSDESGKISTELVQHQEDKDTSDDFTYFDVTASKGDVSVTRRYPAGVTYTNFPFFLVEGGGSSGGGDGDCCLEDIQTKLDNLQNFLEEKMENKGFV
jgi:hypothetical protein